MPLCLLPRPGLNSAHWHLWTTARCRSSASSDTMGSGRSSPRNQNSLVVRWHAPLPTGASWTQLGAAAPALRGTVISPQRSLTRKDQRRLGQSAARVARRRVATALLELTSSLYGILTCQMHAPKAASDYMMILYVAIVGAAYIITMDRDYDAASPIRNLWPCDEARALCNRLPEPLVALRRGKGTIP